MPDDLNNTLGRNIRRLRVGQGWTQDDLAERAGASRNYIASLELGRIAEPGVHRVLRVAKAFDVCMETLLGEPEPFGFRTLRDGQAEVERRFGKQRRPFDALTADEYADAFGDLGLTLDDIAAAAQRALSHLDGAGEISREWASFSFYATGALADAARRARN